MNILPILMIAGFGVFAYLLVLRPARTRAAEQARVVSEVAVGDRIMTTAGMFGTVRSIDDETFELEIAEGVVVRMLKPAIAKLADPAAGGRSVSDEADAVLESAGAADSDPRRDDVIDVTATK